MFDITTARVAAVIPVYRARYLAACLTSALAQTRPPEDIIVVDDGSPDREEIARAVEPHRDRVTLIHQTNQGAGAARNRGILHASAELIAFLDADDLWTPGFLEAQIGLLRERRDLGLVYSNADIIGDSPLRGRLFMDTAPSSGEATVEALLGQRCTVITSSVVVRRDALLEAGMFDVTLRRGQDFDLWVRLAAQGTAIGYTRRPLATRRVHPHNLSGDRVAELQRAVTVLRVLAAKLSLSAHEARILEARLHMLRSQLQLEHGKRDLAAGDLAGATTRFRLAAAGGAGWKTRAVCLALRLAPRLTRQAWLLRTRRPFTAPAAVATGAR